MAAAKVWANAAVAEYFGAATFLNRAPRLRLGLLLSAPVVWLGLAYLGALAALFVTAFWIPSRAT